MDRLVRIIDANANRARESLRVLEDTARFVLDHDPLVREIKNIRHDLRTALEALGLDRLTLVASRDTPGDVGTSVSTGAELRRDDAQDVAVAAASRLTEALRAIEECAKSFDQDASGLFEAIRYRAYDAERRLTLALGTGRARQWSLCVLVTESLCEHASWEDVAEAAAAAGADCLQLREKNLDDDELLARAVRLVDIAHARGASVVINDRIDIALLASADAVHLGQHDLPVGDARRLAGGRLIIGVSTSSADEARRAVHQGADYCGIGPMFESTTKHKPRIVGAAALADYLADPLLAARPHLAIGGITETTLPELTRVGARGIAVSAAVCAATDPSEACRRLREVLDREAVGFRGRRPLV